MNTAFAQKVRWIRRRAKRLKAFFGISRSAAVMDAYLDWISFQGKTFNQLSGDQHAKNR
jgi:hypothetical protein